MPLIIIALVLLIGLLIYSIVKYKALDKVDIPVRQKYPERFRQPSYPENTADTKDFEDGTDADSEDNEAADMSVVKHDQKTLLFPTENLETEKHKRNIH